MIVSRAVSRLSIIAMFFFVFLLSSARAQIAPTNTAAISGSVNDSTGKSVVGATVLLSGPKSTSTHTDVHGLFVFVGMPFGTYQISAAAAGLGTVTQTLTVNGDTNVAIAYQPAGLKTIAHVSSVANASFNVTPASVTQVSPIANAFEGKTSWRTILEQIPGVSQAGLAQGSGATSGYPDGPFMPMKITIDGALPYETAVLLDDMPLIGGAPFSSTATYSSSAGSGTDLGYYPLNGFASADVVRGPGANAPSIVDSIGGSFVLHAPGAVNATHYDLSMSTDPYGGIIANVQAAIRLKKLSMVVTYGVNDSPGPVNEAIISPFDYFGPSALNGASFSCTGSCASYQQIYDPNYSVVSGPIASTQTGLLMCCTQYSGSWSQHAGSASLNYAVSPNVSAEVFYAGRGAEQASIPYASLVSCFLPPTGYAGGIAAGVHFFPLTGGFANTPITEGSSVFEEKITAQIGSGTLRLEALQNRTFTTESAAYPSSVTVQLYGGGSVCSNTSAFCSTGTYMPTVFNGGTYVATFSPESLITRDTSNNRDLLLSYSTSLGSNFHAGVSFVKSYYDVPYVLSLATSFFTITNSLPSAVSNTTNEFRVFAGGNFSDKTSLDLSMYFANTNYHVQNPNDSTGNTYVDARYSYAAPRLGFVWRPTAAVAVRASAGGGFAEAPLCDLVGTNGSPIPSATGTSYAVTLNNLNLQPEKSFAFDLGSDIRLPHNTIVSFDVYRSNLFGQLYQSTAIDGTYLGLPLYVTQYGNLGESRYEGLLIDVRHDTPQGVYWSLAGGLTRGYVISVPGGAAFYNGTITSYPPPFFSPVTTACTYCANLNVVPGVNFNGSFQGAIPYSQASGTLGYRWSPFKYIDIIGTYYGNNNTYYRPAFIEFDGHFGYPLSKNTSILLAFRNITGIYDSPFEMTTPATLSGAPTVSGLPYAQYGEPFGPRTVILTTNVRF